MYRKLNFFLVMMLLGASLFAKQAKYVFLFIGDGMAMPQISSSEEFLKESNQPGMLSFTDFPAQGITKTRSSNSYITDSAAAATAVATGYKTDSGVISMNPQKNISYKSLADIAKEQGKKVGIVSSVSLDHATPACFYATSPTRNDYYGIAKQLVESDFDYFAGGGLKGNSPKKRKDREDLFEIAKANGFKIADTKEEIEKLNSADGKMIAINPVLDGSYAMPYDVDRTEEELSLADFTKKGIDVLEDAENGFFMMVEGGKIDWAGHANDAMSNIGDTIAFSDAVSEAVEFYNEHPADTLIVVTGDHETGGMTLGFAGTKYSTAFSVLGNQKVSNDKFTKLLNEKLPEAKKLSDLAGLVKDSFGLDMDTQSKSKLALTETELADLEKAFQESKKDKSERDKSAQNYLLYGKYDPLTTALSRILSSKAGMGWTTYSHTGVPVPTYAMGLGQELFNGYYENTNIFNKIDYVINN